MQYKMRTCIKELLMSSTLEAEITQGQEFRNPYKISKQMCNVDFLIDL